MKFITTGYPWKDGGLWEQMSKENLPATLLPCDAKQRHYVYEASAGLLRALVSAGAKITLLPENNLEEWKYIFNIELRDVPATMLTEAPVRTE